MKKIVLAIIIFVAYNTTSPAALLRTQAQRILSRSLLLHARNRPGILAALRPDVAPQAYTCHHSTQRHFASPPNNHQAIHKAIVQRTAAKAIIVDHEGDILMLREARTYKEGTNIGKYLLPGGRIDAGEPILKGLKREVFEETGLAIKVGQPFHVGEWFPIIHNIPHHIVGIFFACTPLTNAIRLSTEHDEYAWINPDNTEKYRLTESDRSALVAWKHYKARAAQ